MFVKESDTLIKYCLYARKSSEQDERQAMSIDSQLKEMTAMAEREGLEIVELKQESHSAKQSGQRPVFLQLIEDLRAEKFNGILTWAPDRLSRNAGDLGSLVDLMDSGKLAQIRTFSQSFSNNPNEKFLLMILCSQAKLENDNRAVNVKRGIRAKCEMGWRPCMPPLGYFTRASTGGARDVIIDEKRAPYVVKMFEMSARGLGGRHIMNWLIQNNIKTRKNMKIHLSMIYSMLKNPFYYGEFEYPSGSGNWYHGKHQPLITKELFDKVQARCIVPQKVKWGSKDFPFKGYIKCASCGASIVGEEKFKKLKDGGKNRHVYYHCSRKINYNCPERYLPESALINQLVGISHLLKVSKKNAEPGLWIAINKYGKMIRASNPELDKYQILQGYIKYVLESGSSFEKTRLMRNINNKLVVHNRDLLINGSISQGKIEAKKSSLSQLD